MSSVLTPCNARVLKVERPSSSKYDRYGTPNLVTVFSKTRCRLRITAKVSVDVDGDVVAIDAVLWLPFNKELIPGDLVSIDTAECPQYKVINVLEARDVMGICTGRTYNLVRQRGPAADTS